MGDFVPSAYSAGLSTGVTVSTGAATANVAIPTNGVSNIPRMVVLTATVACHVKLGADNTVTATANDLMVPPNYPFGLLTRGSSFIAYIQEGSAGKLSVSPCEY